MLPESVAEQQSLRYRRNESKAPVAWSLQTNWSRYPGATPNKFRTLDAAAYHNPAHSQAVGRISRVVLTCQALVERVTARSSPASGQAGVQESLHSEWTCSK